MRASALAMAILSLIRLPPRIGGFGATKNSARIKAIDLTNRVHYRQSANDKYYRFMAELFANDQHYCAGVVIDEYWILTAAHCLVTQECKSLVIKLARKYPVQYKSLNINPTGCYPHEKFDNRTRANDIGLIKVQVNLLKNGKMQAVLLPLPGTEYSPNVKAVAVGWGKTEDGAMTAELIQGNVYIGDKGKCKNSLKISGLYRYLQSFGELPREIMCTYEAHSNRPNTCLADSGGPILVGNILVGILSSGVDVDPDQACDVGIAHIESDVVRYLSWIYAHIDPYSVWNPGYDYDYVHIGIDEE